MSTPITITINDVSKAYKHHQAIRHIDKTFVSGHLHLLVGKNGSGKSTLLKCIMNLIDFEGDIRKKRFRIGYAPEKYIMPDFMTVYQFLKSIGRVKDLYEPYLNLELLEYMTLFQIEDRLHDRIRELSNGMKQKINLIQALLNNPKIVLLDEPLVGLDDISQKALIKKIIDLAKQKLIIISTHHPHKFNTSKKAIHYFNQGQII